MIGVMALRLTGKQVMPKPRPFRARLALVRFLSSARTVDGAETFDKDVPELWKVAFLPTTTHSSTRRADDLNGPRGVARHIGSSTVVRREEYAKRATGNPTYATPSDRDKQRRDGLVGLALWGL